MRTFEELQELVQDWADAKGIIIPTLDQTLAQLRKTQEEGQEFENEIWNFFDFGGFESLNEEESNTVQTYKDLKLELGDVFVTLIVAAACLEIDPTECLGLAYEKIKNRTGKVVNGLFEKD